MIEAREGAVAGVSFELRIEVLLLVFRILEVLHALIVSHVA